LDLLTYFIYIFVSLTRLFLNLYTAHSDVGGTGIDTFLRSPGIDFQLAGRYNPI
jgi:hypothetical protein